MSLAGISRVKLFIRDLHCGLQTLQCRAEPYSNSYDTLINFVIKLTDYFMFNSGKRSSAPHFKSNAEYIKYQVWNEVILNKNL